MGLSAFSRSFIYPPRVHMEIRRLTGRSDMLGTPFRDSGERKKQQVVAFLKKFPIFFGPYIGVPGKTH